MGLLKKMKQKLMLRGKSRSHNASDASLPHHSGERIEEVAETDVPYVEPAESVSVQPGPISDAGTSKVKGTLTALVGRTKLRVEWDVTQGAIAKGDRISICPVGCEEELTDWEELNTKRSKGSQRFDSAYSSMERGTEYIARLIRDDEELLRTQPFTKPTKHRPPKVSGSIDVSLQGLNTAVCAWNIIATPGEVELADSDFIHIAVFGSPDEDYVAYETTTGKEKGSVSVDLDSLESGTDYEARYILIEEDVVLLRSAKFQKPPESSSESLSQEVASVSGKESKSSKSSDSSDSDTVSQSDRGESDQDSDEEIALAKPSAKSGKGKVTVVQQGPVLMCEWDLPISVAPNSTDCIGLFRPQAKKDATHEEYSLTNGERKGKRTMIVHNTSSRGWWEIRYLLDDREKPAVPIAYSAPFQIVRNAEIWPAYDGSLKAHFNEEQHTVEVSWKFPKGAFTLANYDMIAICREGHLNPEDYVTSESTNSVEDSGTLTIHPSGQLKNGKTYFARFIARSDGEEYLATSEMFEVNNIKPRVDQTICDITASLDLNGDEPVVKVTWEFPEPLPVLRDSDEIVITPHAVAGKPFHKLESDCNVSGSASGKPKGELTLMVSGYIENGTKFEVHYVSFGKPDISLGHSKPITAQGLPKFNKSNDKEAAMMKTAQFNATSSMQHTITSFKSNVVELNPLLTITPEPSRWESLLQESEATKSKKRSIAESKAIEERERVRKAVKAKGSAAVGGAKNGQKKDVLDEAAFQGEVEAAFSLTPGFIYAGAGVSMSAPSSSPSWWSLMNELLRHTFAAAPEENADLRDCLGEGDVSRQPEEIMESYYFILEDRLFTLFNMLESGDPNSNHIAMAKLAKAGRVKAILTTNFDIFIERALRDEGVSFKVIVTDTEFREYYESGCAEFAVLKIHGTIDRPSTIVAVANHYKMGKGFGGWKATVLAHFMKICPTLFLGYSGWDFEHANYQAFLEQVGEDGGQSVYWLKLKGRVGFGPDLQKLVGKHIGSRLCVGASSLPECAANLVAQWDSEGSKQIMEFHNSIDVDKVNADILQKRTTFLKNWVAEIPSVSLLTLLMIEGTRLNDIVQERMKKQKTLKDKESTTVDSNAMQAGITQLTMDMQSGKISEARYQEKIDMLMLDHTFQYMPLDKARREGLKQAMLAARSNKVFKTRNDGEILQSMLPSYLLMVAERADESTTPNQMVDACLDYIKNKVLKHNGSDPKSATLKEAYMYLTSYLACKPEDQKVLDEMIENFARKAANEGWSSDEATQYRNKVINNKAIAMAYGTIDVEAITRTQTEIACKQAEAGQNAAFLESTMAIALGLQKQTGYRTSSLNSLPEFSSKIATTLGADATKKVSEEVFWDIEKEATKPFQPIVDHLTRLAKQGVNEPGQHTPGEVLATFDIASVQLWVECVKYFSEYSNEQSREVKGFYPRERLAASVVAFLRPRLDRALSVIKDERVLHTLLSLLAIVGEATDDIELMKTAVERSLELTQGKVTEITPYPIPECLANAYQNVGDLASAEKWYALALDGIKTCVMRSKTDAIVLQACLVKAQSSKESALRWAFTYSPHFSTVQQFNLVGAGRSLLVQQASKWASEIGYSTLSEAQEKLMTKSN